MIRRVIVTFCFLLLIIIVIVYSRGYRINFLDDNNKIVSNGLVAVTSSPKSAKFFINGKLSGLTDTTVYLESGEYTFLIAKDGYLPWQKKLTVHGEIVHGIDATLYPVNPSLNPLTNIGVEKSIKFGAGSHKSLILTSLSDESSNTDRLNNGQNNTSEDLSTGGIYVFDPNAGAVTLFSSLNKVAEYSAMPIFSNPDMTFALFSPQYDQAMLIGVEDGIGANEWINKIYDRTELSPNYELPDSFSFIYLISLDGNGQTPLDITSSAESILEAWRNKKHQDLNDLLASYQKEIDTFMTNNTLIIDVAKDKNKIIYIATRSATLKRVLKKPLIGSNQTPEIREVVPNNIYVYDIKEDVNYLLDIESSDGKIDLSEIFFHPNSKNIIFRDVKSIMLSDYDGLNIQKIYTGPSNENFLAVSNDGKLIIHTSLNQNDLQPGDLFAIGIR
jgi:hypothetical protein